jgi:hypothetical protein
MTVAEFRRMALSLADTEERAHMGHPDFRVGGKIFATLGAQKDSGALTLTPEQQKVYVQRDPETFVPCQGAWGLAGSTYVRLKSADPEIVGEALTEAWRNKRLKQSAAKKPVSKKPRA